MFPGLTQFILNSMILNLYFLCTNNTTRDDNILEYNETFAVSISPDLIHNSTAAADCITTLNVVIIDDDHRKLPRTVSITLVTKYYFLLTQW